MSRARAPGARELGPHQAALYAAEAESIDGLGRRWRRRDEVQAYVDAVVDSEWFGRHWDHFVRCTVERRGHGSVWSTNHSLDAGGPAGRPTEGVILLATRGLTQPVVLHELAHLLSSPGSGHGPPFAATFLKLVRHEMGFFAYADLLHALRRRPEFAGLRDIPGDDLA